MLAVHLEDVRDVVEGDGRVLEESRSGLARPIDEVWGGGLDRETWGAYLLALANLGVEHEVSLEEPSHREDPFRALVVLWVDNATTSVRHSLSPPIACVIATYVPSLGDRLVVGVIRVIVVAVVLRVRRIERFHAERTTKVLVGKLEGHEGLLGRKELWSDNHGDG